MGGIKVSIITLQIKIFCPVKFVIARVLWIAARAFHRRRAVRVKGKKSVTRACSVIFY
jgi:hypothetical protein